MDYAMESEFGKGLTYCLGLFLAHAERDMSAYDKLSLQNQKYEMWFNGASDHLYELQIPDFLSDVVKERLNIFKTKVLEWGHGFNKPSATEEDFKWSIREAKTLLMIIDSAIGVETCVASWS